MKNIYNVNFKYCKYLVICNFKFNNEIIEYYSYGVSSPDPYHLKSHVDTIGFWKLKALKK